MYKKIVYLAVAVLLFGSGYWYYSKNKPVQLTPDKIKNTQTIVPAESPKLIENTAIQNVTSPSTETKPLLSDETIKQLPAIDATWETYTDKAQTFEFNWPTRGRYAPTWEVKFADKDCAGEEEGSRQSKNTFEVNGVLFCHVSMQEGAAGSFYLTDVYTTKRDNHYVTITFNKKLASADAMGCDFVNQYPYSTSGQTCIPFDQAIYMSHLDQIISTFKNKN